MFLERSEWRRLTANADETASRRFMPHHDPSGYVQLLIFRLADSLPPPILANLRAAPEARRLALAEAALDAGVGAKTLADPRIAAIVESALVHFDGARYRLLAWSVMPTHVHVLAATVEGWPVASVMHSWKSFTANRANDLLARQGRFWARDYFDRAMRDDVQLERTHAYIEGNPVTAGLCASPADWPWGSASRSRR
jgi:REP element-mobilizing transposase RayT